MTLSDFKAIYWWEWIHRLLGRLIGFVFFAPFLFFAVTGAITRERIPRMLVLFALGGLQGFVGWWMVESGLETRVSVSQYRLAIHLGVAIILLGAILWTALEYLFPPPFTGDVPPKAAEGGQAKRISPLRLASLRSLATSPVNGGGKTAFAFLTLVYIQMLLGALVAGLHAGFVYNTWPSMGGRIFPEGAFVASPWWINLFENAGLAQFDHRVGAYLIAAAAVWLWFGSRVAAQTVRRSADAVLIVTAVQMLLGVVTLLNQVPVLLAALHQATAVALFSSALRHAFECSRERHAAASA